MDHANTIVAEMQQKADKFEKENDDLKRKIEKVQDPFERERIIRDELLMQKPGEVIVQVPTQTPAEEVFPSETTSNGSSLPSSSVENMNVFQKIGAWFIGLFHKK